MVRVTTLTIFDSSLWPPYPLLRAALVTVFCRGTRGICELHPLEKSKVFLLSFFEFLFQDLAFVLRFTLMRDTWLSLRDVFTDHTAILLDSVYISWGFSRCKIALWIRLQISLTVSVSRDSAPSVLFLTIRHGFRAIVSTLSSFASFIRVSRLSCILVILSGPLGCTERLRSHSLIRLSHYHEHRHLSR